MSGDACARARAAARAIFAAGVAAADPAVALAQTWEAVPPPAPGPGGQVLTVALGKAARAMAGVALERRPGSEVLVVTNDENAAPLPGAEVLAAGHPEPDARGAAAARRLIARLGRLGTGDVLVALVSGGGSALLPAPVAGVTLDDKIAVNRLLLAGGFDITETNLVRQALSRLKGGGMARLAAPARVAAYVLSDVVGDDLRVVASGPTVAPVGTRAEAAALLRARGLWERLPAGVRAHLERREATPPLPEAENHLIGGNARSVAAMAAAARAAGWQTVAAQAPLTGDVAAAAETVAGALRAAAPGMALLWGGETTVSVTGPGRGGRNQEMALRVALALERDATPAPADAGTPQEYFGKDECGWVFLSGGTDGRDGPTDAAGGLVDAGSLGRMRAAGCEPAAAAAANDSHAALCASGDLLRTGATGTNVADLQVALRLPGPA